MRPTGYLTLALAAALLWVGYSCGTERADARLYQVERDSAVARERRAVAEARKVDTLWRVRVDSFTRYRTRLDTLRDSLTITDTVEVLRYVAIADSAVRACSVLVVTCEQRVAARDSAIAALRERVRVEAAHRPSRLSVWGNRLLWLGAGYAVGRVQP